MAKSRLSITFLSQLEQGDRITITVTTPLGVQTITERFVNTISGTRQPGYVPIESDLKIQALDLITYLEEDYGARGWVVFKKGIGNTVVVEAVNECSFPDSCQEYRISSFGTSIGYSYKDCNGTVVLKTLTGSSSDQFCAQTGSLNYSGQNATIDVIGSCGSGVTYGATIFASVVMPSATKVNVSIENNDCTDTPPDVIEESVDFSEASSNPCDNINICVTLTEPLVSIGTIDTETTQWDLSYTNGRSGSFNNSGQWRTIPVSISQASNCPDLYLVPIQDFIPWTFKNQTFNPNQLHPEDTQFFLRNSSVAGQRTIKIKYDAKHSTAYNSVYDLFLLHWDVGGNVKEFRYLGGGNQQVHVGAPFNYSVDYEGIFDVEVGDSVMLVQHVIGNIAGSTNSNYVELTNFEFSISCVEDNTVPNSNNPYCVDVPRGQDFLLQGYDANGTFFQQTYTIPNALTIDDISIIWNNTALESIVTIEHQTGLTLEYNIDGGDWQTGNEFVLIPGNSYTLNARDEYGCEVSIPFTIDEDVYNEPKLVIRKACNSLHELNVGKYLNLCGKQYTMKIGFICNAQPNMIKIFKHIQMILSVDYAIKNVLVKTSLDQERFVPGTHMVYRIREGMHSVPLKNPYDYDDLRGSWAYLELEIESIDNQKVDLFSVITHLRKSTI